MTMLPGGQVSAIAQASVDARYQGPAARRIIAERFKISSMVAPRPRSKICDGEQHECKAARRPGRDRPAQPFEDFPEVVRAGDEPEHAGHRGRTHHAIVGPRLGGAVGPGSFRSHDGRGSRRRWFSLLTGSAPGLPLGYSQRDSHVPDRICGLRDLRDCYASVSRPSRQA